MDDSIQKNQLELVVPELRRLTKQTLKLTILVNTLDITKLVWLILLFFQQMSWINWPWWPACMADPR